MGIFHNIIYEPKINKLIRNINYSLSPLLPEKIKIHPSGKLKISINKNLSFYLKTNQTSYLTRQLFWRKPKNFEYTKIFIDLVQNINSFIDVGANIGYYSILGAKINPSLNVFSFEPSTGVMLYLCENAKINNLSDRINIEPQALSNSIGALDFYEIRNPKFPTIYNLSGEHNLGTKKINQSNKIKVESTTLDNYIETKGLANVDLIKLDTEGVENLILEGSIETIKKFQPIIICETLYNKIEKELEAIMSSHNYKFYNHTEKGFINVETLVRTKDNGVRNCFFVPQEKVSLIERWII